MRMKKQHTYLYIILMTVVFSMFSVGCSNDSSSQQRKVNGLNGIYSYPMTLNVEYHDFDNTLTRGAAWQWTDGAQLYMQFHIGNTLVGGTAVYHRQSDSWNITTNQQLSTDSEGICEAYYFTNQNGISGQQVSLSNTSATYTDKEGSFVFTEDNVLFVRLQLTPMIGRIRFKGSASAHFGVDGLSYYNSYDIQKNSFSTANTKLSSSFNQEGTTDYYYMMFSDSEKRQMTVDGTGKAAYIRTFDSSVLAVGQSGYIMLPSTDSIPPGWTLVNKDNLKAIELPAVNATQVQEIGIAKATLSSSIQSNGNGSISDCGFVISTNNAPTIADSRYSYGVATGDFGKTVTGLKEYTTYHVRAYAINEAGTAYGEETTFTTLEVTMPTLSDVTMGTVSNTSAEMTATVTSTGNGTLSDAGFVYSTNHYPTVTDHKLSCGKVTSLSSKATGLTPETTYYVRAYAVNEKGTVYSSEREFKTAKTEINPYTTLTIETSYGSTTLDMAKVQGGTFKMGAQSSSSSQDNYDKNAYSDEKPVHQVTVSTFYISKTLVTQYLWYVVMGSYPSISSQYGLGEDYPVYNVSYTQCQQFINKLKNLTGKNFRVPTEAEWEFAARGGNNSNNTVYSGSSTVGSVAWYSQNASGKTHPVAQKQANELNIYDMNGNLWEWCSDWYALYSSASQTNPTGPTSGSSRVIRGGCYSDNAVDARVSVRSSASPGTGYTTIGLRLVME